MKYIPALDGLRALAVLAVMAFHCGIPGSRLGYLGVDVFFVLSGFLITTILAQQEAAGGIRLGTFYLRRARRLYPALIVMVALYLLSNPLTMARLQDASVALLYLTDITASLWRQPADLLHTWSLSVEEHYYLLWPLILPTLLRIDRKRLRVYLLGAFVVATAWRVESMGGKFYRFDTRLSGLVLGSLLALMPRWHIRWAWVLSVALLGVWINRGEFWAGWLMVATEVAAASAIMLAVNGRMAALNPLAYVGRISYGLYLYHFPIASMLKGYGFGWPAVAAGTVALTFPLAILSHRTVEAWFRSAPRTEAGRDRAGHLASEQMQRTDLRGAVFPQGGE